MTDWSEVEVVDVQVDSRGSADAFVAVDWLKLFAELLARLSERMVCDRILGGLAGLAKLQHLAANGVGVRVSGGYQMVDIIADLRGDTLEVRARRLGVGHDC